MNEATVRAWQLRFIDDWIHIGISTEIAGVHYFVTKDGLVERKRFEETPVIASISPDRAQELIDDLWRCGVRPTEGKGSAGQLKAVEKHLEDMRKIVASKLSVIL